MAIPSKQIGGSVNYNLLWQISKQLERLIEVRSNVSTSTSSSTTTTTTTLDPNLIPIGTQIWTTRNLEVTTYRNGDVIPQVTDPTAWANLTTGAWCYYQNNTANGPIYGKLYNWHAVNDSRGLAPTGYHIPSDAEWTTLTDYLGGVGVAGGKMKATTLWNSPNTDATNSSGFTALPGGLRNNFGTFFNIGSIGTWWSSSGFAAPDAWFRYLEYNNGNASRESSDKKAGFSVRLIKD